MKLFKFIRDSLKNIGFKSNYIPKEDTIGIASPETVKTDEHRAIKEAVRKSFAEQEKQMNLRAMKTHAVSCPDNWTCKKEPCFKPEPDVIVVHESHCHNRNGIIIGDPECECNMSTVKVKDKDFDFELINPDLIALTKKASEKVKKSKITVKK